MTTVLGRRAMLRGIAVVAVVAVTGCGSPSQMTSDAPISVPNIGGDTGSRVKGYGSIEELAGDAAAIVVVDEAARVETRRIADADFSVTSSNVRQTLAGEIDTTSPIIIHTFATDLATSQLVLSEPGQYLVFLTPFYTKIGEVTGEWTVTGGPAGVYVQLRDGSFHKLDTESPGLPEVVNLDQLSKLTLKPASYFIETGADLR